MGQSNEIFFSLPIRKKINLVLMENRFVLFPFCYTCWELQWRWNGTAIEILSQEEFTHSPYFDLQKKKKNVKLASDQGSGLFQYYDNASTTDNVMTEVSNFLFLILGRILFWNVRKRIKRFIREQLHWWRHSVIEKMNRVITQLKSILRIYITVFIIWVLICAERRHGHCSVSFHCDFMDT